MSPKARYRDPFPPARSERCFCGSGNRFKHCCGRGDAERPPPWGVIELDGFLDATTCRELVEFAAERPAERLKVVDWENSDADHVAYMLDERRVTERVDMGPREAEMHALFASIYRDTIAPRVGHAFAWFEAPQVLKYRPGGFYQAHADADSYEVETGRWHHDLDRDISVLLYLNDEFSGGELVFEYFGYRIRPRPGLLVWFPSDARYYHGAEAVTAGTRYAIVSWAAYADTEKRRNAPPERAVMLEASPDPD